MLVFTSSQKNQLSYFSGSSFFIEAFAQSLRNLANVPGATIADLARQTGENTARSDIACAANPPTLFQQPLKTTPVQLNPNPNSNPNQPQVPVGMPNQAFGQFGQPGLQGLPPCARAGGSGTNGQSNYQGNNYQGQNNNNNGNQYQYQNQNNSDVDSDQGGWFYD